MLKARKINLFFVFILISFILSDFLAFFSENLILEINNFKYIFIFYLSITAAFILLCYLLNKLKLNLVSIGRLEYQKGFDILFNTIF